MRYGDRLAAAHRRPEGTALVPALEARPARAPARAPASAASVRSATASSRAAPGPDVAARLPPAASSADDWLVVTYHMALQDRIDDASPRSPRSTLARSRRSCSMTHLAAWVLLLHRRRRRPHASPKPQGRTRPTGSSAFLHRARAARTKLPARPRHRGDADRPRCDRTSTRSSASPAPRLPSPTRTSRNARCATTSSDVEFVGANCLGVTAAAEGGTSVARMAQPVE